MCHPIWVEALSQGCESEVAASPADREPSLDPGVKGAAFADRWQCPDGLPLSQYRGQRRTGLRVGACGRDSLLMSSPWALEIRVKQKQTLNARGQAGMCPHPQAVCASPVCPSLLAGAWSPPLGFWVLCRVGAGILPESRPWGSSSCP